MSEPAPVYQTPEPQPPAAASVSTPESGTWAILELFGHKVVAGYMVVDQQFGVPMVRLDVPASAAFPAFTRHYHPNAVYSVSYVSEEAARYTAEALHENPVSVYVPALGDLARLQDENKRMGDKLFRLQKALEDQRQLTAGERD